MRILLCCMMVVSLLGAHVVAQEKTSKKAKPVSSEFVSFDGVKLYLAFDAADNRQALKEYLSKGENLENWGRLASVRVFKEMNDPKRATEQLALGIKAHNPQVQMALKHYEDRGESVIDFVTWPADLAFVEFNVFKYAKLKDGGVVAYQYALRSYGDEESKKFLREFRPVRERLVKLMAEKGLDTKKSALP
jgi:hypothetical protein